MSWDLLVCVWCVCASVYVSLPLPLPLPLALSLSRSFALSRADKWHSMCVYIVYIRSVKVHTIHTNPYETKKNKIKNQKKEQQRASRKDHQQTRTINKRKTHPSRTMFEANSFNLYICKIHVCVCVCVYIYIYTYVCKCVCVCVCEYIYMCSYQLCLLTCLPVRSASHGPAMRKQVNNQ